MPHPSDGSVVKRILEQWPKVFEAIKIFDSAHGSFDGEAVMEVVDEFNKTIEELKRIA